MTEQTINLGNWSNLNVDTITNLYLYGQTSTPITYTDRIRPTRRLAVTRRRWR